MDDNTIKKLETIVSHIKNGRCVLFLGAGASCDAGGLSGPDFVKLIKEKFPDIDQSKNDFIEICQDVIDTPPYTRIDLEGLIKEKLYNLQPTKAHKVLTKYDWPAIFTTNYDDLVEISYRLSTDRCKICQPVYSEVPQINPSNKEKIYLFKMMGCITASDDFKNNMVLSRADYNKAIYRRREYFKLLADFIKNGTILFIGYSFEDLIVFDVIDELIDNYTIDRIPYSYALFDKIQLDEKNCNKFNKRKIFPLQYSFKDFFEFIEENLITTKDVDSQNKHIKLKNCSIDINDREISQYAEYFEILTEEKINQPPENKDDYFMGKNKSWGVFKEEWDFKRDIYVLPKFTRLIEKKEIVGCLHDRVFDELKKYDINNNKVILLKGMGGVGKTTTLRRLAYDIYKAGEGPVLIINTTRVSFDYKLISSFIEGINYQINTKKSEQGHIQQIKPVIIIDNAGSMIRHVNRLKDYLTSRGRPVLIIAAERTAEWDLKIKEFPFKMQKDNIYELNEQLSDSEEERIIEHLYNIGFVQTKGDFWKSIVETNFDNSYFATIYSLVHPSKKPLNEIIKNQYLNLSEFTQKAFKFICVFHQYDLPVNIELLVRSLKCSYDTFFTEMINKDGSKVIFEEQDEIGNLLYRSHHRIIAKKTSEFFFPDPEEQKNIFIEILKEAILRNEKEREICEKLLVEYIGPNAKPKVFTPDQQRQIFKTICEGNPERSLLHHWGIIEADDQKYLEAEILFKKALEIQRDNVESYRGESDQHILTSLGSLYSHMGLYYNKRNQPIEAKECFAKAEESFFGAKHGEFPNGHAYHSHSHMWYMKGLETKQKDEKIEFLCRALQILSDAKDNLNSEELEQIYELETKIWADIGDETRINQCMEVLREKYQSPRGYYLNAELIRRKAKEKEKDEKEKKELLLLALDKIKEGLSYFSTDEHCLRLQSKLFKEVYPGDYQNFYKSLISWKGVASSPNAWLLYELGRTSFILEYYDSSKDVFRELETGVGMGHKLRARPRNPIINDSGNKKEFQGTITDIYSSYEGLIKCDTLRNLKYKIAFRPISCSWTPVRGNSVIFFIEFSYRGPRAENVKRV